MGKIAIDGVSTGMNGIYLAYINSNQELKVGTFDDSKGGDFTLLGKGNIDDNVLKISLAVNPVTHEPVVAYVVKGGIIRVKRFDGLNWDIVGDIMVHNLTTKDINPALKGLSIIFDNNGRLFLAYQDIYAKVWHIDNTLN